MLEKFRLVVFDLDGVLVDSYHCWRNLLNEMLSERGKPVLTNAEFAAGWGQGVDEDQRLFFSEITVEQVIEEYGKRFPAHARWVRSEPGAHELLHALKGAGKQLAVASNSPVVVVELLLHQSGLYSYFNSLAGIDLVAEGKPAPDLILHALEKTGIPADEACYVGDSEFDAQAAAAARVRFIGYKRPGDIRVDSLKQLIDRENA